MVDLPSNLLDALRSKNVVLFLGAGASADARHPEGKTIPGAAQLRDMLADKFLAGRLKDRSLSEVTEYAVNESDLLDIQKFVRDVLIRFGPADYHRILPQFPWRALFTTNLDLVIERAYEEETRRAQNPVVFIKDAQKFDQELKAVSESLEYVKLHGSCDHYQDLAIPFILATEQYTKYSQHRERLFNRMKDLAAEYNLVFCGYSVLDPHIQAILHSMFVLGAVRPAYFIVKPTFDAVEARYWTGKRVTPIVSTFAEFLHSLQENLDPRLITVGARAIGSRHPVARFYVKSNVSETADLLSFLQRDVEFIHSGMSAASQAATDFYKGFDSGFYPIMDDMDVRRNVTDSILATVFLRSDDNLNAPDLYLLRAPAGTGKTIILKRLAWEAATEFDCLVLFHKSNGSLRVSALEELYSYVGRRIFLAVDKAAYHVDELSQLFDECKARGLPVTIVVAERDNEWSVRCEKLDSKLDTAFEIHRFAHNEIEALVDKLATFDALGRLADISRDVRVKEFEERAERQILVMLYELTQGVPFEKLLVDEYERIIPTEAQLLYLDVCCLNRLNVPIRAGLISRVSNIHFTEFKSRLFEPLKQIVIVQRDEYIGDMLYVARHATIAQIVFENILNDQEKRFDTLVRIVDAMNLSYSSDDAAFRSMVTGREIANLFPSQELGRRFFDVAIKVSGEDASIVQQRAIFEINHAGGNPLTGLEWIEKAEKIKPYDRAIRHTKGNILRACANESKNTLKRDEYRKIARRTLAPLVGLDARQAHGFHTLALILLDDIRDYLSEKESETSSRGEEDRVLVQKLEELQGVIRNGLAIFPEESRLHAAEAEYYRVIQNDSRALQSLKRAFERNRRLDWIAVRLANIYRINGERDRSLEVLRQAVEANPNGRDGNFALGRMLAESTDPGERSTAIEYLRRSFTKGDSNFTAQLWYGRELFLAGRYQESDEIFAALGRASVPSDVKQAVTGIVRDTTGGQKLYRGTIVKREEGFLFVSLPDVPRDIFVFRGEVYAKDWLQAKVSSEVEMKIGFTYRGPCGTDLRIL